MRGGQEPRPLRGDPPLGQRPLRLQKKARHFGEKSWLYVVTEARTDEPELHRIQEPAAHFRESEDIFATGFIVHEQTWRERSKVD